MRSRILSLLVSLPVTLSLACTQIEDDPAALELDDAAALGDELDEPSALVAETPVQADGPLAAAIAAHPSFASLSTFAWQRSSSMLGTYATLSPAQVDTEANRLEYCTYQTNPVTCYEELASVDVPFTLPNSAKTAGQTLTSTFGLGTMTPSQRVALFHAAQQIYVANGGAGGNPAMIPGTVAGSACNASCKADMLIVLGQAQAGVVTAASMSGGGGGGLGEMLLKVAIEIAVDVITHWIECLANPDCDTWPEGSGEDECTHDDDCAPDGWCRKGPLGFGDNECRDKRENGEACSRDAKCESDCCKFSLWDLGSTCRPASECN